MFWVLGELLALNIDWLVMLCVLLWLPDMCALWEGGVCVERLPACLVGGGTGGEGDQANKENCSFLILPLLSW